MAAAAGRRKDAARRLSPVTFGDPCRSRSAYLGTGSPPRECLDDRGCRSRRHRRRDTGMARQFNLDRRHRRRGWKTGTTLVRQWRGRAHTILVCEDGFEYEGQRYRSLTMIAERITGAHWSGPRFFGLIKRAGASVDAAAGR